jgi:hypothetical protein
MHKCAVLPWSPATGCALAISTCGEHTSSIGVLGLWGGGGLLVSDCEPELLIRLGRGGGAVIAASSAPLASPRRPSTPSTQMRRKTPESLSSCMTESLILLHTRERCIVCKQDVSSMELGQTADRQTSQPDEQSHITCN